MSRVALAAVATNNHRNTTRCHRYYYYYYSSRSVSSFKTTAVAKNYATTLPRIRANAAAAATDAVDSSADASATATNKLNLHIIPPRAIFPWRSCSYPLPRLIQPTRHGNDGVVKSDSFFGTTTKHPSTEENDNTTTTTVEEDDYYNCDYYNKGGPLGPGWPSPMLPWFRSALQYTSLNLLGYSWWNLILPWKRKEMEMELQEGFCAAFANGVNGMIYDTYYINTNQPHYQQLQQQKYDKDAILAEEEASVNESNKDGSSSSNLDVEFDVDANISLDPLPPPSASASASNLKEDGIDTPTTSADTAGSAAAATPANEDEKNNNKCDDSSTTKDNDVISNNSNSNDNEEYSMLQFNLRNLYQSAKKHSHPNKINILLRTEPQSAKIESMFPIFGLSRSLVEDRPNLRHTYRNYIKQLQEKHKEKIITTGKSSSRLNPIEMGTFVMDRLQEVMSKSAQLSNDGKAVITIVAQVSIQCKEIFIVRDSITGDVLQGVDDLQPRDVTHLVRFEMILRETLINEDDETNNDGSKNQGGQSNNDDDWEIEIGRWQITDWDDLLDGNVFFT
jgi:hypothetical protein